MLYGSFDNLLIICGYAATSDKRACYLVFPSMEQEPNQTWLIIGFLLSFDDYRSGRAGGGGGS